MTSSRSAPALVATAIALAAALGLGACSTTSGGTPVTLSTTTTAGADLGPTTSTTAEPDAAAGTKLFVYAPEAGDCIDLRATTDNGATTTRDLPEADATPHGSNELILRLDCELPHQYEVIAVASADLPGEPDDGRADHGRQEAVPSRVLDLRGHAVPDLRPGGRLGAPQRRPTRPWRPADRLPRVRHHRQAHRVGARLGPLARIDPAGAGPTGSTGRSLSGPRSGAGASHRTRAAPRRGRALAQARSNASP